MTKEDSIWKKVNNDAYKTKLEYPTKSKLSIKAKIDQFGSNLSDLMTTLPDAPMRGVLLTAMNMVSPLLRELDDIDIKLDAYHADKSKLEDQFREDLKSEFDTTDYIDEPAIFNLAWSLGHSSGYGEVLNYYSEICEKFETNIKRTKNLMQLVRGLAQYEPNSGENCKFCGFSPHVSNCFVFRARKLITGDKK